MSYYPRKKREKSWALPKKQHEKRKQSNVSICQRCCWWLNVTIVSETIENWNHTVAHIYTNTEHFFWLVRWSVIVAVVLFLFHVPQQMYYDTIFTQFTQPLSRKWQSTSQTLRSDSEQDAAQGKKSCETEATILHPMSDNRIKANQKLLITFYCCQCYFFFAYSILFAFLFSS